MNYDEYYKVIKNYTYLPKYLNTNDFYIVEPLSKFKVESFFKVHKQNVESNNSNSKKPIEIIYNINETTDHLEFLESKIREKYLKDINYNKQHHAVKIGRKGVNEDFNRTNTSEFFVSNKNNDKNIVNNKTIYENDVDNIVNDNLQLTNNNSNANIKKNEYIVKANNSFKTLPPSLNNNKSHYNNTISNFNSSKSKTIDRVNTDTNQDNVDLNSKNKDDNYYYNTLTNFPANYSKDLQSDKSNNIFNLTSNFKDIEKFRIKINRDKKVKELSKAKLTRQFPLINAVNKRKEKYEEVIDIRSSKFNQQNNKIASTTITNSNMIYNKTNNMFLDNLLNKTNLDSSNKNYIKSVSVLSSENIQDPNEDYYSTKTQNKNVTTNFNRTASIVNSQTKSNFYNNTNKFSIKLGENYFITQKRLQKTYNYKNYLKNKQNLEYLSSLKYEQLNKLNDLNTNVSVLNPSFKSNKKNISKKDLKEIIKNRLRSVPHKKYSKCLFKEVKTNNIEFEYENCLK